MASSVIHAEVDWDRKFEPATQREISTLRRDPRVNSTVSIHLASNGGRLDATGKPTAGQQSFHMGPGQKLVGGQLGWGYAEQTRGVQGMGRTMDPAEILAMFRDTATAGLQPSKSAAGANHGGPDRSMTAPAGATRGRQLVYWDGKDRHTVSPPPGHAGTAQSESLREGWMLPQGNYTNKTSYRPGTTAKPGNAAQTCQTLYGMSSAMLADQSLAGSIRTYGLVFKPIGHKDYEQVARGMDSVGAWTKTRGDLMSSISVGKPSRLMGPWEHTTTKLAHLV